MENHKGETTFMKDADTCSYLSDAYDHYDYYCKIKTKPIILKECNNCEYFYSR